MNLVYIISKIDSAFHSQVKELLLELSHYVQHITLIMGEQNVSILNEFANYKNISVIYFKTYPQYPVLDYFTIKSLKKTLIKITINNSTLIHTRGEYAAWLAFNCLPNYKEKILCDIRGVSIEEMDYLKLNYLQRIIKRSYFKFVLKFILNNLRITCISSTLKEYLIKISKPKYEIEINTCTAGKNFIYNKEYRAIVREKLNIKNSEKLVVFSTGGGHKWQNEQLIIDKLLTLDVKTLVLSKKKYDNPKIISTFAQYADVPAYLNASDIAIIWRNNSIVNNVASPIKFFEYIACGLPIIASNTVEQITTLINQNKIGICLMDIDELNNDILNNLSNINRENVSKLGNEYKVNKNASIYYQLYLKILALNENTHL